MKKQFVILYTCLFIGAVLLMSSCKKEDKSPDADIFFGVDINGSEVSFNNETTGAVSYRWDFGDGESSTEESPTHTYPGKGKYVATLFATNSAGKEKEGSTILRLSKGSSVKLDDNTFSDWDTVVTNVYNAGANGGIAKKVKYDYDANYVYFYIETASAKANGDIYDFYIDPDNNASTGFITWLFSGSGNDILIEGAMLDNWFDVFYHSGAQDSFGGYAYQSISDFYSIGNIEEAGGILKFEARISRSKLKGMTGTGLKFGISITKSDWSETLGNLPDQGSPSLYLNMED